jgi:hypothetical protein
MNPLIRIYGIPTSDAPVWTEEAPKPNQTVEIDSNDTDTAFLVADPDFAYWEALPTAYIVGSWDAYTGLQEGESWDESEPPVVIGTPDHPVTADYTDWIRPLGNLERSATGELDSHRWVGHVPPKFLQGDSRYTDANDPFVLTITRTDNTYPDWDAGTTYDTGDKVMHDGQGWEAQQTNNTNHEPGQPGSAPWWAVTASGYGWIATMIEPAVSQDPITNYNIRVYPTAECVPGEQIYTSGNFAESDGIFTAETTSNQWTPTADAVNIALIFVGGGNTQNGIITMDVGQNEVTAQFWESDQ